VLGYFQRIREDIRLRCTDRLKPNGISEADLARIVDDVIESHHRLWKSARFVSRLPAGQARRLRKRYMGDVKKRRGK
jgi:hypothetical protein